MEELSCSICLIELSIESDFATTNCNHSFHTSCLIQSKTSHCPLCRNDLYIQPEDDLDENIFNESIFTQEVIESLFEDNLSEHNSLPDSLSAIANINNLDDLSNQDTKILLRLIIQMNHIIQDNNEKLVEAVSTLIN